MEYICFILLYSLWKRRWKKKNTGLFYKPCQNDCLKIAYIVLSVARCACSIWSVGLLADCSRCKFYELSGFLWDSMKTVTFLWYCFTYYAFMYLLYFWYIFIHTFHIVTYILSVDVFLHGQAAVSMVDRVCFGWTVCVQADQLGDLSHFAGPLWPSLVDTIKHHR